MPLQTLAVAVFFLMLAIWNTRLNSEVETAKQEQRQDMQSVVGHLRTTVPTSFCEAFRAWELSRVLYDKASYFSWHEPWCNDEIQTTCDEIRVLRRHQAAAFGASFIKALKADAIPDCEFRSPSWRVPGPTVRYPGFHRADTNEVTDHILTLYHDLAL